jgi:Xaa-Pro aminopeptidase
VAWLQRPASAAPIDRGAASAALSAARLDGLVASSRQNVYYVTGALTLEPLVDPGGVAFGVLPADAAAPARLVLPSYERFALEDLAPVGLDVFTFGPAYVKGAPPAEVAPSAPAALRRGLEAAGLDRARLGAELSVLPSAWLERIARELPGLTLVDAGPLLAGLRAVKTAEEQARIERAATVADEAIAEVFERLRPGDTELDVARRIAQGLLEREAEPALVQVGAGERGAQIISYATRRPLRDGDLVRVDVCPQLGNYHADLSRCCVMGTPSAEQHRYYGGAREALEAAIGALAATRTPAAALAAANGRLHELGLGEFERASVGHGTGLQVHEGPSLDAGGGAPLADGTVLSVEVPLYVGGLGGFTPEDVVVIGADGLRRVTRAAAALG